MIESERLASPRPGCVPPSVPRTRIVVGVEVSSPSWLFSSASTGFGTRAFASEMPLRDGEVARDEPDDAEQEHERERERDPAARRAARAGFAVARPGAGVLAPAGRRALQRDLALRPTALVHPVGLLLFGHPGGYRSRDVHEERVIGVDLGGTKILAGLVARDGTIGRTIEIATPDGDAGRGAGRDRRRRRGPARRTARPRSATACRSTSTGARASRSGRSTSRSTTSTSPTARASATASRPASRTTATRRRSPSGGSGRGGARPT